jgi:hypothetical protein
VHYAPLTDRTQVYRVDEDPGETEDLAPAQPLEALLLRQGLLMQAAANRSLLEQKGAGQAGEELDADSLEQLEALGYLN